MTTYLKFHRSKLLCERQNLQAKNTQIVTANNHFPKKNGRVLDEFYNFYSHKNRKSITLDSDYHRLPKGRIGEVKEGNKNYSYHS